MSLSICNQILIVINRRVASFNDVHTSPLAHRFGPGSRALMGRCDVPIWVILWIDLSFALRINSKDKWKKVMALVIASFWRIAQTWRSDTHVPSYSVFGWFICHLDLKSLFVFLKFSFLKFNIKRCQWHFESHYLCADAEVRFLYEELNTIIL